LGFILSPIKKLIRKAILSSTGELFKRQENFNSHLVRLLNRQTEFITQISKLFPQINTILASQREMNLHLVSFCNQINFREDVLTIKSQHTEELIRELYRRMDNLYIVSNLAYILEEKVKKLEKELKTERDSMGEFLSQSTTQTQ